MDLLPYPADARLPPIEVPYICADFIDELELKQGFCIITHLEKLPDCQAWYPVNRDEAVQKAQAHLFFGLLYDVWNAPLPLEDLLRHSDTLGTTVVSLQQLSEARFFSVRRRDGLVEYMHPCLEILYRHLRYIRQLSDLGDVIGLSVETLLWVAIGSTPPYHDNRLLQDRMLRAGWCPYWTKAYCEKYSSPVLYYLSGMNRSRHEQHPWCTANSSCTVHDINNATYETLHATRCARQTCHVVGPDVRKLEKIILNGGIPLIRFREVPLATDSSKDDTAQTVQVLGSNTYQPSTAKSVVKIDIVEHVFGRPFIAVSHVWAGGLGNPNANKLPQCQIDYLFKYARQCQHRSYGKQISYGGHTLLLDEVDDYYILQMIQSGIIEDTSTVYVWMDTLCIPADETLDDLGGLKEKCIEKMAQIYALAMHTLVIDHIVRDLPLEAEASAVDLAVELVTCPWMGRSWTFQEACLSRDFSFALRDGLLNPRKWGKDKALQTFQGQLLMEILALFDDLPDVLNQAVQEAEPANATSVFIEVWNELAVRRTTYSEDLHGILAVLLGLSPLEILLAANGTKKSPSQRMIAIIKSQQFLPLAMLFMPYPEGTALGQTPESQDWLPQFPAGRLNMDFGQMYWSTDGERLHFRLEDANSCALIVDGIGSDKTNNISVEQQKHASSEGVDVLVTLGDISISFTLSEFQARGITSDGQFCFVLHGFRNAELLSGQGACFNYLGMVEKSMKLRYICPIKYSVRPKFKVDAGEPLSVNRTGPSDNQNFHWVDDVTCFMDCDSSTWSAPLYSRRFAVPRQSSLSMPIAAFVALHWIIWSTRIYNLPGWETWVYQPSKASLRRFQLPYVGIFFRGISRMDKWSRARWLYGPIFVVPVRLIYFSAIDYPRMEVVAERVRYERFAHSFELIPMSDLSRPTERTISRRLREEPLYQFKNRWLVGGSLAIATVYQSHLLGALSQLLWKAEPDQRDFISVADSMMGMGIVWEVVGRVCVELVWRCFRLDLKRPRKRRQRFWGIGLWSGWFTSIISMNGST